MALSSDFHRGREYSYQGVVLGSPPQRESKSVLKPRRLLAARGMGQSTHKVTHSEQREKKKKKKKKSRRAPRG
jgi:hypothetical protein